MTLTQILAVLPHLLGMGPQALAVLGSVVVLLTALHTVLAAVAALFPAASPAARFLAIAGLDVDKAVRGLVALVGVLKRFVGNVAGAAIVLLLAGCTPSQLQQAATIADDVTRIAEVLCLADHARTAHARALSVADACSTVEQLAPYIEQAKGRLPRAACGQSDAGVGR